MRLHTTGTLLGTLRTGPFQRVAHLCPVSPSRLAGRWRGDPEGSRNLRYATVATPELRPDLCCNISVNAREHPIRLLRRGVLARVARGIYMLAGAPLTEHHGLALVGKQAPNAVVCLLSALQFHGLTTQQPREVWIAVGVKAHRPTIGWPAVHVVRFSGAR